MRLFLVRHGHTFAPDQINGPKEVMLGCNNDLPLVEKGKGYALAFAHYLQTRNLQPTAIYTNYLKRTSEHAQIIATQFGLNNLIKQTDALLEFDYGNWAGLKTSGNTAQTNEVIAKFGMQAWQDWQQRRIIPNQSPHFWKITKAEIIGKLQDFLKFLTKNYQPDDTIVAIGSQGSISFINELLPGGMASAVQENRQSIKPGHFSEFELDINSESLTLNNWNLSPV